MVHVFRFNKFTFQCINPDYLLDVSGHCHVGHVSGINLALCSVNLAEAADDSLPAGKLAEVYATAALTAALSFPTGM